MSNNGWFRLYAEARTDKKLATLTDSEFRVWFNLLCYAADNADSRGTIPQMKDHLLTVEVSNGDRSLLNGTLQKLVDLDIVAVSDDGITFVHYKERQYEYPSWRPEATRERVQKHRALKQDVTTVKQAVTRVTRRSDPDQTQIRSDNSASLARKVQTWGHHEDQERFTESMLKELADVFLEGEVRETIDLALSHSSSTKYKRLDLYVAGWLRRNAKQERDRRGRNGNSNGRATPGQGLPVQPSAFAAYRNG